MRTGGLLAYSPPNDANLFSSSDTQRKTLKHEWEAGPILHDDVLEFNRAPSRPFLGWLLILDLVRCFLLDPVFPSILDNYQQLV